MAQKMYSKKLVPSRKCFKKVRFIKIKILPSAVTAHLIFVLCVPKQARRSVPSPPSNGEENLILFDYITGTFFLD